VTASRRPTITLAVPSQTSFLSLVSDVTRQMAAHAGFEEATCGRLALAVDEAATNAIEHAYGGAPDREVVVRFDDAGTRSRSRSRTTAPPSTRRRFRRSTSTASSASGAPAAWACT